MRAEDKAVLQELQRNGDDLSSPREATLYFYRLKGDGRPGAALFDSLVTEGREKGLKVRRRDEDALILEGNLRVDPEALAPLIGWAVEVAETNQVEFDGWECAVVRRKS